MVQKSWANRSEAVATCYLKGKLVGGGLGGWRPTDPMCADQPSKAGGRKEKGWRADLEE